MVRKASHYRAVVKRTDSSQAISSLCTLRAGLEPRPWNLAAEHGQLVTEHHNLQVLGSITPCERCEQLDGAADRQVGEFREHPRSLPDISGGVTLLRHE